MCTVKIKKILQNSNGISMKGKWIRKNTVNTSHGAENMQFFEINHAGSIAAHWKYDSIPEKVHLSILHH